MPKESVLRLVTTDFSRLFRSMTDIVKPFNKAMEEQEKVLVRRTKLEEEASNRVVRMVGKVRNAEKQAIDKAVVTETAMLGQGNQPNGITASLEFGKILLNTGAYQMMGSTVSNTAGYVAGSKHGSEAENIASGAAGGAVTGTMTGAMAVTMLGAQLGSVIPVWGTVIGAAAGTIIGAMLGGFQGNIENKQDQDDSFKDIVKSQFDKVIAQQQEDIQLGSQLAAGQEVNSMVPWRVSTESFAGLTQQLNTLEQSKQAAMGEGYNQERKEGLSKQITYLSGEDGQQMLEANKLIGEYQASLENEQEEILRKHQSEALQTISDKGLDGAEAGRLLMEAQVAAENEYRKGEGYQLQLQTQTTMLDNLRMDLTDGWENFGHTMGQQFTFGIERGKADIWKKLNPNNFETVGIPHRFIESSTHSDAWGMDYSSPKDDGQPSTPLSTHSSAWGMDYLPAKKAFGMDYVPYDNFPALLHQGERVLTASEARSTNSTTQPVTITGNSFIVREEADIDRIAASLYKQLAKARLTYAP